MGIGVLSFSLAGCTSNLRWVTETQFIAPACIPNRLPTWDDFSRKDPPSATPSAQTAIRFLLNDTPPHIIAKFDQQYSWVKPKSADPSNPAEWIASERLLAHEQVHFLISCLLVRQANQSLQPEEDPQKMLELVKSVAQRINVQYDLDTKHGTDDEAQQNWEAQVQEQFEDVTIQTKKTRVNLSRTPH
ncbi:MAG: hypothetical protein NPIRA04_29030 [Nitrospirales bacterium]|nr:MAG: hypothetical protein NPIRA04_29030 [Nitrospirales bacterium]